MTTATAPKVADALEAPTPRRAQCPRCRRPPVVCYCPHLPELPSRTRVLLLQHPRERDNAIGTARMAHLALPNSVLRVGVDFSQDEVVAQHLGGAVPSYLLFPGRDCRDVADLPQDSPLNLVVLDGTWWQAGNLLKRNPILQRLPRVAFTPQKLSDYRIRRQPAPFCVSTIEALVEVLNRLESAHGPFDRLLDPFRAMIARQEWFATQVRSQRHHHEPRPLRVPALIGRLGAEWDRLVCVQGEANAWPKSAPARQPAEIVHWTAFRPTTGESYEAVVAPRRTLAPGTPAHTGLSAAELQAGGTVAAWQESWQTFVRPGDRLVFWGRFYRDLAVAEGLPLHPDSIDLRVALSQLTRQRAGTIEDCAQRLQAPAGTPLLGGRAGRRLSTLVSLLTVAIQTAPQVQRR